MNNSRNSSPSLLPKTISSLDKSLLKDIEQSLATEEGQRYISYLEQYFQTHLPVFQGKQGSYDALDAMRRDAYREVFLLIRHHIQQTLVKKTIENTPSPKL